MKKRTLQGARALVSGASSGIGRELALELVRRGARVCGVARRQDRLDALRETVASESGVENAFISVVGDICDSVVRTEALEKVVSEFGGLDLLVNNAGAGATLAVEETSDELACELFDLNFFAPFELTKEAMKLLRASASDAARGDKIAPTVVNLSSIVGLRGTPYYGVYGAAKSALATLTDAWRAEAKRDGVNFVTIAPGTTSTEFFDVLREDVVRPNLPPHKPATPKDVALAIVDAVERGKRRVIPSSSARLLAAVNRICPGLVDSLMFDSATSQK